MDLVFISFIYLFLWSDIIIQNIIDIRDESFKSASYTPRVGNKVNEVSAVSLCTVSCNTVIMYVVFGMQSDNVIPSIKYCFQAFFILLFIASYSYLTTKMQLHLIKYVHYAQL